jgi:hypothetical protein
MKSAGAVEVLAMTGLAMTVLGVIRGASTALRDGLTPNDVPSPAALGGV